MRIFVVAGKAGSGKSLVAQYINEFYIYKLENCVVTGYSKYLKNFATELTDWDGISENKPRKFLQDFGSKIRDYNAEFFTKRMIEDINIYNIGNIDDVIISDARMPEEIEKLKENFDNVYSIYIENQFAQSKLTLEEQTHITETALENYNDFDCTIVNDGTTEDLKNKVFNYLEGIK